MSQDIEQILAQAHQLIEDDSLAQARALLEPLRESQKDNADFWWVYLHAVEDPGEAHAALRELMRIDPDYPGARDLNTRLEDSGYVQTVTVDDDFDDLDDLDLDDLDDLDEEEEPVEKKRSRRGLLVRLVAVLVIVLLVILIAMLLNGSSGDDDDEGDATPTEEVAALATFTAIPEVTEMATEEVITAEPTEEVMTEEPTEEMVTPEPTEEVITEEPTEEMVTTEPTEEVMTEEPTEEMVITEPTPTEEVMTEEPTEAIGAQAVPSDVPATPTQEVMTEEPTEETAPENPLLAALADYTLAADTLTVEETPQFGTTSLALICVDTAQPLRPTIEGAIQTISQVSDKVDAGVQAIGVRLLDCASQTVLNTVGTRLEDAVQYAAGNIDDSSFTSRWRALG